MKPLRIAVPACSLYADPERKVFKNKTLQYAEEKLLRAIWRSGVEPIGIFDPGEPLREGFLRSLLADCQGMVLQGGSDVCPRSYGEEPLRPEWNGDEVRDQFEAGAVRIALELSVPILGICRGAQLVNVALGGSLLQDISHQRPDALTHRDWHRYEDLEHPVVLLPNSWVAEVMGPGPLLVNTVHHQAIARLAPSLRAVAHAPDGIIEAVELINSDRFLAALQWHPEWLDGSTAGGPHRSPGDRIFGAFAEVCRARIA